MKNPPLHGQLPAGLGGRELVVHHLAQEYQRLGHRVVVAGAGGMWRHRKLRYGYPMHRWPRIPFASMESASLIHLLRTQIVRRFDVVHVHGTYPMGYTAARLKNWLDFPLLITPHGGDINVVPEIGFGLRLDPEVDTKIRFAVSRADYLTAISETIVASLRDAGARESAIVRIANGVDTERFQALQNFDAFDFLGIPRDSRLVVTVGNYRAVKGHELLVESLHSAIAREPRLRLAIVGAKSPEFCERVRAEGMDEYVKFTGVLPMPLPGDAEPDILAAMLQAADIYVSASVGEGAEGLSLALLEAIAAGCCAVVTDISGNRDFVTHEQNGLLVRPGSAEALSEALVRVCTDHALREKLRKCGPNAVVGFRWRDVANEYLKLYERAISDHKLPRRGAFTQA